MSRPPLNDEDKAFLARLEPTKKRTTFARYVFDEIRGHKWRPEQYRGLPATNPNYILQEVMDRIRAQIHKKIDRDAWDQDAEEKAQWGEALVLYHDEALRYIGWCLAWEQRSKREKDGYKWNQYQRFRVQRVTPRVEADGSYDLTPTLDAFARQKYGLFGALEHPWPELLEEYSR